MFRLIDITIDIIFFSINWKNYFDRSILVISMTVLLMGQVTTVYLGMVARWRGVLIKGPILMVAPPISKPKEL